ncbi:hypothetical protein KIPB_003110 [Kipferlia bialata]|uniref:Uncharacterized protein n=1 Tax=Kipferlia bialata TaxID=797122 RepID=A0A9K3CRS8_9EUKA|nr:hypothetical protein KIPB_003110 [Kipferlia bialata]|eukprot:g3110.t1
MQGDRAVYTAPDDILAAATALQVVGTLISTPRTLSDRDMCTVLTGCQAMLQMDAEEAPPLSHSACLEIVARTLASRPSLFSAKTNATDPLPLHVVLTLTACLPHLHEGEGLGYTGGPAVALSLLGAPLVLGDRGREALRHSGMAEAEIDTLRTHWAQGIVPACPLSEEERDGLLQVLGDVAPRSLGHMEVCHYAACRFSGLKQGSLTKADVAKAYTKLVQYESGARLVGRLYALPLFCSLIEGSDSPLCQWALSAPHTPTYKGHTLRREACEAGVKGLTLLSTLDRVCDSTPCGLVPPALLSHPLLEGERERVEALRNLCAVAAQADWSPRADAETVVATI